MQKKRKKRLFFKNKQFPKIIFKIFFDFFFSKINRFFFSNIKKFPKLILKFFSNFFFRKFFFPILFPTTFFLSKIFFIEFFWRKYFLSNFFGEIFVFSQKFFCKDIFHNIFTNFFCIRCLRNNVFREIFYSKFCLLRIFMFCNFGVRKKIFLRFFFQR